jgi:hypothetical protein
VLGSRHCGGGVGSRWSRAGKILSKGLAASRSKVYIPFPATSDWVTARQDALPPKPSGFRHPSRTTPLFPLSGGISARGRAGEAGRQKLFRAFPDDEKFIEKELAAEKARAYIPAPAADDEEKRRRRNRERAVKPNKVSASVRRSAGEKKFHWGVAKEKLGCYILLHFDGAGGSRNRMVPEGIALLYK